MKKNTITTRRLLTASQEKILKLIASGNSSKQIAGILNISAYTVGNHRSNILRKLNARNTMEALMLYNISMNEK